MLITREEYYGERLEEMPFTAAVVLFCIVSAALIVFIACLMGGLKS